VALPAVGVVDEEGDDDANDGKSAAKWSNLLKDHQHRQ